MSLTPLRLIACCLLSGSLALPSFTLAEDAQIAALFAQEQVSGSLVLHALHTGNTIIHNDARAAQRFTPASTFKVLNSLIALQENAVANKDSVFKWNGQHYSIANWNQDQTLASAFQRSCVWCYQQLADKIGAKTYSRVLKQLHYGELREPFNLKRFWLDGELQISSLEQIAFLRQVQQHELPFSSDTYQTLSEIMLVEQTPAYRLWGKTGLGGAAPTQVGWYIGYIETADDLWFFAANLEITNLDQLPLRQQLVHAALKTKGVIL